MADKKIKRVDPNDAPVGLRIEAGNKAMDDYHNDKKNWPLSKYEERGRGVDASNEAASEYAREANRAQTMQGVNYPDTTKKKKGGMIKSSASKRADGIAQRGKTKGRLV